MASSDRDFRSACNIRAAAYSHHDPETGPRFGASDPMDRVEGTAVLLYRDTESGQDFGTARIQMSAFGPLALESGLCLPEWLANRPRAQISRLAVLAGAGPLVKLYLMKASYQYCLATQVRWMVIGARKPALIRNYRNLGFIDVFEPGAWKPLASGVGLPHLILAFDVVGAQAAWLESKNRLYRFMTEPQEEELLSLPVIDSVSQPLEILAD